MIRGKWFTSGSAAFCDAALFVDGENYQLKTEKHPPKTGLISAIQVSDRIGNVQRKLTFEDGSVFSTEDNDAIDQAFASKNKLKSLIHTLESKLSFVFIALVLTGVFAFSFVKWGIPTISTGIANALPQKTNDLIGSHTFEFIDEYLFDESQLDKERQDQIRAHFKSKLETSHITNEKINYTLHFRDWSYAGEGIPNALALPSGDIIVTDKFIELSKSQNEIDSVLLHEMGHIAHRHSLKMVIQSTIVTSIVMMVTGDANAIADLGIGLGSVLLSSNYSRDFESDADKFAFDKMLKLGIDPIAFANIMRRITEHSEASFGNKKKDPNEQTDYMPPRKDDAEEKVSDYLSTHPSTEERAQIAERYSECFKQGLKTCDLTK